MTHDITWCPPAEVLGDQIWKSKHEKDHDSHLSPKERDISNENNTQSRC